MFIKNGLRALLQVGLIASAVLNVNSAPLEESQGTVVDKTSTLVGMDAHSKTWRSQSGGELKEVGTGMNYWDGQRWNPTDPTFEVTANGEAAIASRTQHKVQLAANLYMTNAVTLITPDGIILHSTPVGIGLYDAASGNFSLIGAITNCSGSLASGNQVVYKNAFSGVCADVVYTLEKGAFHQDVVITGRLNPADFGFPAETTRIQILTEFYDAPTPEVMRRPLYVERNLSIRSQMASPDLMDEVLGFGEMVFGTGRAFTSATPDQGQKPGVLVGKSFTSVDGRTFLVESIDYKAIASELQRLPDCQRPSGSAGMMKKAIKARSAYALLPKIPQMAPVTAGIRKFSPKFAQLEKPLSVVIDYVATIGGTMNSSLVLQGDTTYFISSPLICNGAVTIEGGAVIKYPQANLVSGTGSYIQLNNSLTLTTDRYRPAVFTAGDDNSVGSTLTTNIWSGYTGNPGSNYYAYPALSFSFWPMVSNLRFKYAAQAIAVACTDYSHPDIAIANSQFINCLQGVDMAIGSFLPNIAIKNSLFSNVQYPFIENGGGNNNYSLFNCTFDNTLQLTPGFSQMNFTNCVFANVTSDTNLFAGLDNGFYNSSQFGDSQFLSAVSPFKTVGGGQYYLPTNSAFIGVGTTNIDPSLLADLRQKTVYPPIVWANTFYSTTTNLYPQTNRDAGASLNLGYHYDPIDYAFGNVTVTNATLTIMPGAVIGSFDTNNSGYSLTIGQGGAFLAQGTATSPSRVVMYNTVQEQSTTNWSTPVQGMILSNGLTNGPASIINCRFGDFSILANDSAHLFATMGNTAPIGFQDCQFHGGSLTTTNPTINLTNSLLERVSAKLWFFDGNTPYLRNNLFWHGTNDIQFPGMTNAIIQDNLFDQTGINDHGSTSYVGGYNGYVTNFNRLTLNNATDQILSNSPAYQTGPFGRYYYPTNLPLIDAGSKTNAGLAGLHHYTTTTNQVKEGSSPLDIGFHYVAVGINGLPVDSNNDGVPDYLADHNGDGLFDFPALFVTGSDPALISSDNAIQSRLEGMDFVVTRKSDGDAQSNDATNKNLVVISRSVFPPNVNTKFSKSGVPVLDLESDLFDDFGFTGTTNGTDYAGQTGQTQINIVNSLHSMAAGLSGTVTVSDTSSIFAWGKPNSNAVQVAELSGVSTNQATIFGCEKGAFMMNLVAPARRAGFFVQDADHLTASGWLLFDAAVNWLVSTNITVITNYPSQISLLSPTNGQVFTAGDNIPVSAQVIDNDTGVQRVDFYYANYRIGQTSTGSNNVYSLVWSNAPAGVYQMRVRAVDYADVSTISNTTVTITIRSNALFVVGSTNLSASDLLVSNRLSSLGFGLKIKQASGSAAADAVGQTLVVISDSASPSDVTNKFASITVPLVTWSSALYGDLCLVSSTNSGVEPGQSQLDVINSSHPMAAGLSGNVIVLTNSGSISWGRPNTNAISIATLSGDLSKQAIFGYELGAHMPGLVAQARRVGLFLSDTNTALVNDSGWTLFDAAIRWAVEKPCPPALDVMLVIDHSGSMNGQPLLDAKAAAINLVNSLNPGIDQVGLVTFGTSANLDHVLTTNFNDVIATINGISAFDNTRIDLGISAGQAELSTNRHNPLALPVMVLLTDGSNAPVYTTSTNIPIVSANAKAAGTRMIAVGLGQVDEQYLPGVASSSSDYYFTPVSSELSDIYASIATSLCRSTNNPPTVAITNPPSGAIYDSYTNIIISATAQDDHGITQVAFYDNLTNLIGISTSAPYQITWTNPPGGKHSIIAKATDTDGLTGISAPILITVNPLVVIVAPATNAMLTEITNVTISAGVSNSGVAISKVDFYNRTNLIGSSTSLSNGVYNFATNFSAGYSPITAVAVTVEGVSNRSPIRMVHVKSTNTPPDVSITFPTTNAVFADGADITITAVANAHGSALVTNVEFFVNGQSVGNDPTSPYAIDKCCWKPGTYVIVAKATDNLGSIKVSDPVTNTIVKELVGQGFWDPTFHPTNSAGLSPIPADECGNYFDLEAVYQAVVSGPALYLAALDDTWPCSYPCGQEDLTNPSLYKSDGTNWNHWAGAAASCHPFPFGTVTGRPNGVGGVALNDSGIYVAGFPTNNIDCVVERLNGTNWTELGDAFQNGLYPFDPFSDDRAIGFQLPRLRFVGSDLYLYGNFVYGADTNIQCLAKWNANSLAWEQVGALLNGPVWAVSSLKGNLVIGGQFTAAGGNTNANYVAELVDGNWRNLEDGVGGLDWSSTAGSNVNVGVFSLAVCETNLFVGGDFTFAGNKTNANGIAIWNGLEWKTLGNGLSTHGIDSGGDLYYPGLATCTNPIVYSIAPHGDTVYIGGAFNGAMNGDGTHVSAASVVKASWNENSQEWTWSDMDVGVSIQSPSDEVLPGKVSTMAIMDGPNPGAYDVIVGGAGFVNGFRYAGSAQNKLRALARWRVGYPQPPTAPVVAITNPPNYMVLTNDSSNPSTITLTASATSSYTNIDHVDFYVDGFDLGPATDNLDGSFSASLTLTNGVRTVTANTTDAVGMIGKSQPVFVIVKATNSPINAVNDSYTIYDNIPATSLPVLTNDIAASPVLISQVLQPNSGLGRATISHNRKSLTYTPLPNIYGTDVFFYSVTNASGDADWATVTVKILAPPRVTISTPADQDRIPVPASPLVITGTAGAWGEGNSITNVKLLTISGSGVTSTNRLPSGSGFSFNWTNSTPGWYTFIAVASDNNGATNASQPVTISLYDSNAPVHALTALITNLVPTIDDLGATKDPVITEGIFDLKGVAADSIATNPVSYRVLLYQPDSGVAAASDDLNYRAMLYSWSPPFADVTPGPVNAQGFHIGGSTDGELGSLNLTGVPNGVYELVLQVRGASEVTNTMVEVQLGSQLKIGQFSFSEQDLVIPASGIPLTVIRTYNSLNPLQGDFGYSWSYALNSMDVQLNEERTTVTVGGDQAPIADDEESDSGLPLEVSIRTGGGRDVTLTLPGGRRTTFAFAPELHGFGATAKWTPPADVHAKLETLGNPEILGLPTLMWAEGLDGSDFVTHDVPGWKLTTQDGTEYYITRGPVNNVYYSPDGHPISVQVYGTPRLTQIRQRTGDTIQINDGGIFHYNKNNVPTRSVLFERDTQGRITAIHDPISGSNGLASVKYIYHQETGNLLQVLRLTDRNTGTYTTNKYHYDNPNFPHYITSIEDARGIPIAHNEYDDNGRLTAVVDADGNRTDFLHDTTNHVEVVTDRLGNKTSHAYDTQGNVIATTNALQQVTLMSYDALNNKTNEIVVGVSTNSFGYDEKGFLTATTNALGYTNGFTYDSYGHQLISIDARGFVTSNYYDSSTGNLLSTSDAYNTNSYVYNTLNQLVASIDALGNSTTNGYDFSGNLTNVTRLSSNGTVMISTGYAYDDNGNRTSQNVLRTTASATVHDITSFVYDGQNRLVKTIDPDEKTIESVYNEIGKRASSKDKLGRITQYVYDERGNLVKTIYPDLTSEASVYDEAVRRIYSTNRLTQVTRYVYDELGRVIQTIAPDNTTNRIYYELGGRVCYTIDARGVTNAFLYDAQGRQLAVTNGYNTAEQTVLFYTYDSNGNRLTMGDGLQHTNFYFYDGLSRMTNTIFPDGSKVTTTFDTLGRRVAVTDQATNTTHFGYDSLGRLTSVTDALNHVTHYEYDEAGNQINQADALNRKTIFEFDSLGRRTKRILPGLQTETFGYDAEGNLLYHTNFNGVVITNVYSSLNQLLATIYPDGSSNSFTYTDSGQRKTMTDLSGNYFYVYDNRDRLRTNVTPQGTLVYDYDDNGNLTRMRSLTFNGTDITYQYDALSRLTNVLDARVSLTTTNPTYCYDKVGNLEALAYPNGVTNLYQYDSLNRLKQLTWKLNTSTLADFTYQLGPTGNRKNLQEVVDGVNRTNTWTYDLLYRLTGETVGASSGTNGSLTYDYDDVGNRTGRTGNLGMLSDASYTYNTNDWLSTDAYDDNGNTTTSIGINYRYDYENHLTNFNNGEVLIVYNANGQRVKKMVVSGGTTNTTLFLVSELNLTGYPQVLEELNVTGGTTNLDRAYVYGLALMSQRQGNGTVSFYGHDGHGSTRFLVDTNGAISDTYLYDAYGNLISSNGATPNHYLYTGEQYDFDLGLYYLRLRYLNPNSGRFWSMDSYEGNQGDPLSLHRYTFCKNNPGNYLDRSGANTEVEVGFSAEEAALIDEANAIVTATFNSIARERLAVSILKGTLDTLDALSFLDEIRSLSEQPALPLIPDQSQYKKYQSKTLGFRQFGKCDNYATNVALPGPKWFIAYRLRPDYWPDKGGYVGWLGMTERFAGASVSLNGFHAGRIANGLVFDNFYSGIPVPDWPLLYQVLKIPSRGEEVCTLAEAHVSGFGEIKIFKGVCPTSYSDPLWNQPGIDFPTLKH